MASSIFEGDLKLVSGLNDLNPVDIDVRLGDVVTDPGLENYVLISLFVERRADNNDILPIGQTDRRGWWGDSILGFKLGSKLWLLRGERLNQTLLERAKQYVEEALEWMIQEEIADSIIVNVTRDPDFINRIILNIVITKAGTDQYGYQYYFNWQNQVLKKVV